MPKNSAKTLPNILVEGTIDTKARLYLDADGNPVLVPSESVATFLANKRQQELQKNSQNQLPSFVIESIDVEAVVHGSQAKLTGTFNIGLTKSAPKVVAIPLRFDSCQLIDAPLFTSGGENLIEVRNSAGYQWYVQAEPDTKHSVRLSGGVVVARQGDRNELRLNLPDSKSLTVVTLPLNAIDENVRGQGDEIVQRDVTKDAVILTIRGTGGENVISWRDSDARDRVSAVEASSVTRIQIDEPLGTWKLSSDLTLRWFGSDAKDSITLTLPPGARWLELPTSQGERYTISNSEKDAKAGGVQSVVPESSQAAVETAPQSIVVRNADPSLMQPIELRVEWEWTPPAESDEQPTKPLRVPSLMIGNVDAHAGTTELLIPTSYAPIWQEQPGTQLVQQTRPSDLFDRNQYLFRFSRQPLQLTAGFRRPTSVSSIRPTYLAHVDGYKIKLTAWLDCTFDPTHPMEVSMLPTDWMVESAEVVDMKTPHAPGESLSLQLQPDGSVRIANYEPELEDFSEQRRLRQVWRVIAYRPVQLTPANRAEFQLPQLGIYNDRGETSYDHGSGVLIITGSENLLLKSNAEATKGLLVDSLVPQWQPLLTETASKQPLFYRFQSRGESPKWSGSAEPLPQQIVLGQQALLQVGPANVRISQDFTLQIANEPLSQLRLAIRRDAVNYVAPQVTIDGVPIPLAQINSLDQSTSSLPAAEPIATEIQAVDSIKSESIKSDPSQAELAQPALVANSVSPSEPAVVTPQTDNKPTPQRKETRWQIFEPISVAALRGEVKINIRTEIHWSAQAESGMTQVGVPLVQLIVPRETRIREQTRSLKWDRELEVFESPDTASENAVSKMLTAGEESQELSVGQAEVLLNVRKLENLNYLPVRIGRTWLQTIVNGNERRDRYCMQVESDLRQLSIRLPNGRTMNHVLVDGKRVTVRSVLTDEGTQFQIDLPNKEGRQHQVEIWFSSSQLLEWLTSLDIDVPIIEGAQFYDRLYWQLAVPSIQHFGFASSRMTPDWNWNWNGLWWNRESHMKQADLERWVGATTQTDMPTSVNSYVLSSFGDAKPFRVWVLSRFVMWLPIGLLAILVSMLLVTFRTLRHPGFLLLASACIATTAMLAPDLAVLLGQTALVSLGLVSLILITQAAIENRVRRRSVFTVRPSHVTDRSDHLSLARNVKISPPSSTRAHSSVIADGES